MICASDRESPRSRASSAASAKNASGHLTVVRVDEGTAGRQRPHHERRVAEFPCSCQGPLGLFAALGRACERQQQRFVREARTRAADASALGALSPASAALEPVQSFLHSSPRQPQWLQRRRQRQRQLGIRSFSAPGESGSQIVHFGFRPVDALLVAAVRRRVQQRRPSRCSGRGDGSARRHLRGPRGAFPVRTDERSPAAGSGFRAAVSSATTSDLSTSSVSWSSTW